MTGSSVSSVIGFEGLFQLLYSEILYFNAEEVRDFQGLDFQDTCTLMNKGRPNRNFAAATKNVPTKKQWTVAMSFVLRLMLNPNGVVSKVISFRNGVVEMLSIGVTLARYCFALIPNLVTSMTYK